MSEENNAIVNDELLEKYKKYIIRINRKKVLIEFLKAAGIAIYTSLWWIGIVFNDGFAYTLVSSLTALAILLYILIILCDEPVWPAREKDASTKESNVVGCNCETK